MNTPLSEYQQRVNDLLVLRAAKPVSATEIGRLCGLNGEQVCKAIGGLRRRYSCDYEHDPIETIHTSKPVRVYYRFSKETLQSLYDATKMLRDRDATAACEALTVRSRISASEQWERAS